MSSQPLDLLLGCLLRTIPLSLRWIAATAVGGGGVAGVVVFCHEAGEFVGRARPRSSGFGTGIGACSRESRGVCGGSRHDAWIGIEVR